MDNTADAISRITGWSLEDPERLPSVDDRKDIDDDSLAVLKVRIRESRSMRICVTKFAEALETDTDEECIKATEGINMADLQDVVIEVNNINLSSKADITNAPSAVLGSWHTTPDPQKLDILLNMYGHGDEDAGDHKFSEDIEDLDRARAAMYETKPVSYTHLRAHET